MQRYLHTTRLIRKGAHHATAYSGIGCKCYETTPGWLNFHQPVNRATLPDRYDLPSEFPEEPGLPDEFHDLQPQLLSRSLSLVDYQRDNWFTGSDLNLYDRRGASPLA